MSVRSLWTSVLAASVASAVLLSPVQAQAASSPASSTAEAVEQIVVDSGAVLTVDFDSPIGEAEAAEAADELSASDASVSLVFDDGTERAAASSSGARLGRAARPPLGCGNQRVDLDSNGRFTIDYQDVLTFRHDVGSGGTGTVVWAGSVQTTRTLP